MQNELFLAFFKCIFAVLVEGNMKQKRIGTSHASIDIIIEYSKFTTDTHCMLLLLFLFNQIIYSLFTSITKHVGGSAGPSPTHTTWSRFL